MQQQPTARWRSFRKEDCLTEIADLDRHISIDGEDSDSATLVSGLRDRPHVVLLGEPGSGKSTALEREAIAVGTVAVTVRRLLKRGPPAHAATLFIDALDEFRSGGAHDKIHDLAAAIENSGCDRWWLTCRAEDWRKLGDLAVLDEITAGRPIVVAHLQPLEPLDQRAVLRALGEPDPDAFLEKARRLGAEGLLGSPLSLRLLQGAVAKGGTWPKTRFDLFDRATLQLGGEYDPVRRTTMTRPSPEILRDAAGRAFLVQLASGARAIWRSNVEPDEDGFVRGFDLGLDPNVLKAALDTPLFTGEGEAFEPIHRSVAEFLAARSLAAAVAGSPGQSALPLRRALALITTNDGGPPTELRGLFGWFTVHLAQNGRVADALKLIQAEPTTALAYGDPAALPTQCRRALFEYLDTGDPWFGSGQASAIVGALAGDDLADLFATVLDGGSRGTDKLTTVLEAVTVGVPVVSLRPRLRAMVLDEKQSEGMRWRAIDAFLNGYEDRAGEQRALFDALAALEPSNDNGRLKLHLITDMPGDVVTLADLKSVVIDSVTTRRRNSSLNLYGLSRWFERNPKPGLLAEPLDNWLPKAEDHQQPYSIELHGFIDTVLATLITSENPSPQQLQVMVHNAAMRRWSRMRDATKAAMDRWLSASPDRAIGLLDALVQATPEPNRVGKIFTRFEMLAPHTISSTLIREIVARAASAGDDQRIWLQLASIFVWRIDPRNDVFWEIVDVIGEHPEMADLAQGMTYEEIPDWRLEEAERTKVRNAEFAAAVVGNIEVMSPKIDKLRSGEATGWLDWGAQNYLHPHEVDPHQVTGLDRVTRLANGDIAQAMATGWMHLASHAKANLTPARLGTLEAEGKRATAEYSMVAGLAYKRSVAIDAGTPPMSVALACLRNAHIVEDTAERDILRRWAVDCLTRDPIVGGAALLDFWMSALKAKSPRLEYMSAFADTGATMLAPVIVELLGKRPNMPIEALGTALQYAIRLLDRETLVGLARKAQRKKTLGEDQRARWYATAFRLDPVGVGDQFEAELCDDKRRMSLELAERAEGPTAFDGLSEHAAITRDTLLVRHVGSSNVPDNRWGGGRVGLQQTLSGIVTAAIARLAALPSLQAGKALDTLAQLPTLTLWAPRLLHSVAEQVRVRRDFAFQNPAPAAVCAALSGGPPVNAADLRAVVLDELDRIGRSLQTGSTSPWRRYWNTDGSSRPIGPRNENECRNQVLDLLELAMNPFGITAALPEGHRANDTRSDMLILGHAGANLPVEAKRHYNDELWTAPVEQLEPYSRAPGAAGFGIYLVFWFGAAFAAPKRADGARVKTFEGTLALLEADLPEVLRDRISIVAFDVSVPPGTNMSALAKPRVKKAPVTAT